MPLQNHILDNQADTVADHLRHGLRQADAFNLASAYFTIYGYELLAEELDGVGSVRFLFGSPTSVEDLDPGANDPKSFERTEQGWNPTVPCDRRLSPSAAPNGCAGTPWWSARSAGPTSRTATGEYVAG